MFHYFLKTIVSVQYKTDHSSPCGQSFYIREIKHDITSNGKRQKWNLLSVFTELSVP